MSIVTECNAAAVLWYDYQEVTEAPLGNILRRSEANVWGFV